MDFPLLPPTLDSNFLPPATQNINFDFNALNNITEPVDVVEEEKQKIEFSGKTPSGDSYLSFSIPNVAFSDWFTTEQLTRGISYVPYTDRVMKAFVRRNKTLDYRKFICHVENCPSILHTVRHLHRPNTIDICYIYTHNHAIDTKNLPMDPIVHNVVHTMLTQGNKHLQVKRIVPLLDSVFKYAPENNSALAPSHSTLSSLGNSIKAKDFVRINSNNLRGSSVDDVLCSRDLIKYKTLAESLIRYYNCVRSLQSTTLDWWRASQQCESNSVPSLDFVVNSPVINLCQPLLKTLQNKKRIDIVKDGKEQTINYSSSDIAKAAKTMNLNPRLSVFNVETNGEVDWKQSFVIYLTMLRASFPSLLENDVGELVKQVSSDILNDVYSMDPKAQDIEIGPLYFKNE